MSETPQVYTKPYTSTEFGEIMDRVIQRSTVKPPGSDCVIWTGRKHHEFGYPIVRLAGVAPVNVKKYLSNDPFARKPDYQPIFHTTCDMRKLCINPDHNYVAAVRPIPRGTDNPPK